MSDGEKLKNEQSANITYLRAIAGGWPPFSALSIELHRACDDIEAYREQEKAP